MHTRLGSLLRCVGGLATLALPACAWAAGGPPAEYAVRWNPDEGGPASGQEALNVLGLSREDSDTFTVQYFSVNVRSDAPAGFSTIARSRQKGGKTQLTVKFRGQESLVTLPALSSWNCPLGAGSDKKDEVDISIVKDGSVKRAFSRSCTLETEGTQGFPDFLAAQPSRCTYTMTRMKARSVKVEEWVLQGSSTRLLEVSMVGPDSAATLQKFQNDIVKSLKSKRMKPADRSKSEAGSDCG